MNFNCFFPASSSSSSIEVKQVRKANRLIIRSFLAMICLFPYAANAQATKGLPEAEIKGRELARQLCESGPAENYTNTGVMQIRDESGNRTNLPITIEVNVTQTNWWSRYVVKAGDNGNEITTLTVTHRFGHPNQYSAFEKDQKASLGGLASFQIRTGESGNWTMIPFANSDFWLSDLGLEFFHWPDQKVLPKTTNLKRGRSYTLLESTNPEPDTNGYSRVVSWIDQETGGILEAEAYDTHGKLLKVFEPKSFKKVNGQWELQEMEIRNVQTGSRTRLEFDLKK